MSVEDGGEEDMYGTAFPDMFSSMFARGYSRWPKARLEPTHACLQLARLLPIQFHSIASAESAYDSDSRQDDDSNASSSCLFH